MIVDAIVLAGGRSSRLDAVPKAQLVVEGRTLLSRTLDAAATARRIVVVGPQPSSPLPEEVLLVQEDPPFAGPVAAIAAGLAALETVDDAPSDAVLVLACDMPHIERAIPRLLRGLADDPDTDGAIAVDAGQHLQPLAAGYRTSPLARALADLAAAGSLDGARVFQLLDTLYLTPLDMPENATADVDTWDDAGRLGAAIPAE